MKKLLILAIVLFAPFSTFAAFDQDVSYGSTGPAVSELQEFLGAHSFFAGPYSGNFYSLTVSGVKRFQLANGIPNTGYFGPRSRAAAKAIIATEITNDETSTTTPAAPVAVSTGNAAPPAISTPGGSTIPVTTPPMLTQLSCSLTIGPEGVNRLRLADGTFINSPSGQFQMQWVFDEGATGILTSDHGDNGELNASAGTKEIRTLGTATYTLTVSKDGYQSATCTATATHQV